MKAIEQESKLKSWIVQYQDKSCAGTGSLKEMSVPFAIVASGKRRVGHMCNKLVHKLDSGNICCVVHSTEMRDKSTWRKAVEAAQKGRLCMVGIGNSTSDITAIILQHLEKDDTQAKIHIAARTIPPVFPKQKILRVDTVGYLLRWMPDMFQEHLVKLLWSFFETSRICDSAFPSHLKRWSKINGRVPVIDKHDMLSSGFKSGQLVGHGPILFVNDNQEVFFGDKPIMIGNHCPPPGTQGTKIDMVILGTGYKDDCVIGREDRLNGLYKVGFGNDYFLPLKAISNEAKVIAQDIASNLRYSKHST